MWFPERSSRAFARRKFLKLAGGAMGAAVALGSGGTFVPAQRADAQVSLTLFVDALPIPKVIAPSGQLGGGPFYQVTSRSSALTRVGAFSSRTSRCA